LYTKEGLGKAREIIDLYKELHDSKIEIFEDPRRTISSVKEMLKNENLSSEILSEYTLLN
jgi:hypothetical protein